MVCARKLADLNDQITGSYPCMRNRELCYAYLSLNEPDRAETELLRNIETYEARIDYVRNQPLTQLQYLQKGLDFANSSIQEANELITKIRSGQIEQLISEAKEREHNSMEKCKAFFHIM